MGVKTPLQLRRPLNHLAYLRSGFYIRQLLQGLGRFEGFLYAVFQLILVCEIGHHFTGSRKPRQGHSNLWYRSRPFLYQHLVMPVGQAMTALSRPCLSPRRGSNKWCGCGLAHTLYPKGGRERSLEGDRSVSDSIRSQILPGSLHVFRSKATNAVAWKGK